MLDCTRPQGSPVIDPRSGFGVNRSLPLSASFSSLFFPPAYMPQESNVTDLRTGFPATGWFKKKKKMFFDLPDPRVQRHRPPFWRFSMSRRCSPQAVYSRPPPLIWFSRTLPCAYFALTTIGPGCPTTWGQPNHGEVISVLGVLVCYFGSTTVASARLLSFRLQNRGDIVPSGVFGVCPPALSPPIARSPPFVQATKTW